MGTNIYFVRHAHSVYTPDELGRPLSERGRLDAMKVADIFKEEKIDMVVSSPYMRAKETVEGVAKYFKLPIIAIEGFRERTISARPVDDFEGSIYKLWYEEDFAFEGGESNRQAQMRALSDLLKLLEQHKGKNIVIGTHGNIMVLMMNYFDSSYHYGFWKQLAMPDIYKLAFDDELKLNHVSRLWNV